MPFFLDALKTTGHFQFWPPGLIVSTCNLSIRKYADVENRSISTIYLKRWRPTENKTHIIVKTILIVTYIIESKNYDTSLHQQYVKPKTWCLYSSSQLKRRNVYKYVYFFTLRWYNSWAQYLGPSEQYRATVWKPSKLNFEKIPR